MKQRRVWWLLALLFAAAAVFALSRIAGGEPEAGRTIREVEESLSARYGKVISALEKTGEAGREVYVGTVENETGTYQVVADAETGRVIRITPLAKKQTPPDKTVQPVDESKETPPVPPANNELAKSGISLDRAKQIALQQVAGTFDSIEVEHKNGATVYEVEIKTDENREVKVSIDPLTGQVLSIMWED
ncbi:PepSY domain-containing protein [Brevibacillus sp. 1238]|uniref:PepSY domain-containing protein n=1 Tax=Brevibacillus sp. 1238 TaxID=2940565 RepID=UPI00247511EA|nr:PepSY domain-containing protein [Brevibacillus sp. 1238]MDH6349584.1 putative membrane protein YkoI [Brevibacillus sp. 1238]